MPLLPDFNVEPGKIISNKNTDDKNYSRSSGKLPDFNVEPGKIVGKVSPEVNPAYNRIIESTKNAPRTAIGEVFQPFAGAAEGFMSLASGAIAPLTGTSYAITEGVRGAFNAITGDKTARPMDMNAAYVQGRNDYTYEPRSDSGKQTVEYLSKIAEPIAYVPRKITEIALEKGYIDKNAAVPLEDALNTAIGVGITLGGQIAKPRVVKAATIATDVVKQEAGKLATAVKPTVETLKTEAGYVGEAIKPATDAVKNAGSAMANAASKAANATGISNVAEYVKTHKAGAIPAGIAMAFGVSPELAAGIGHIIGEAAKSKAGKISKADIQLDKTINSSMKLRKDVVYEGKPEYDPVTGVSSMLAPEITALTGAEQLAKINSSELSSGTKMYEYTRINNNAVIAERLRESAEARGYNSVGELIAKDPKSAAVFSKLNADKESYVRKPSTTAELAQAWYEKYKPVDYVGELDVSMPVSDATRSSAYGLSKVDSRVMKGTDKEQPITGKKPVIDEPNTQTINDEVPATKFTTPFDSTGDSIYDAAKNMGTKGTVDSPSSYAGSQEVKNAAAKWVESQNDSIITLAGSPGQGKSSLFEAYTSHIPKERKFELWPGTMSKAKLEKVVSKINDTSTKGTVAVLIDEADKFTSAEQSIIDYLVTTAGSKKGAGRIKIAFTTNDINKMNAVWGDSSTIGSNEIILGKPSKKDLRSYAYGINEAQQLNLSADQIDSYVNKSESYRDVSTKMGAEYNASKPIDEDVFSGFSSGIDIGEAEDILIKNKVSPSTIRDWTAQTPGSPVYLIVEQGSDAYNALPSSSHRSVTMGQGIMDSDKGVRIGGIEQLEDYITSHGRHLDELTVEINKKSDLIALSKFNRPVEINGRKVDPPRIIVAVKPGIEFDTSVTNAILSRAVDARNKSK